MKELTKKHKEVYEHVMGKKLSQEELIEIHKDATTPFEELDKLGWRRRLMITLFIAIIGGIVIGSVVRFLY